MKEFAVAFTGASGAPYGLTVLRALLAQGHKVHVMLSEGAARCLRQECDLSVSPKQPDPAVLAPEHADLLVPHSIANIGATIASGSSPLEGMAVCPCSMGTLGRIAGGIADNLTTRAADVCLKERRTLVLVPRETPLNAIHLENMLRLDRAGAVLLPANPGFYHRPRSIDDLVRFVAGRVLQQLGVDQDLVPPWLGQ